MTIKVSANLGFLWVNHSIPEAIKKASKFKFDAIEFHWPYDQEPDEIKELCIERMNEQKKTDVVSQVGIHFMKFCAKWNLQRMSDAAQTYAPMLNGKWDE